MVSDLKSAINSYWLSLAHCDPLLSCCFQDAFFIFGFQQFDCVSQCGSLWVYLLEDFWASWMCSVLSFFTFEGSAINSSNILSAPFSPLLLGTPIGLMLVCLMVSHRSQALFIFLHIFFLSTLRLENFIWPILDSFLCLLKSAVETSSGFFISVVLHSSSGIPIWFLFIISVSLLTSSFSPSVNGPYFLLSLHAS